MSESFGRGMKIFRENLAGMYANGHMTKWADVDTSVDLDRLQRAHDHELEQARKAEYARGYEDGRRSKDADHAAVALRLSRLTFNGGSHENLARIAYAIYPCATGWTCESSKGLRDRLIDLLGGVHNRDGLVHRCFNACGDPGPRGVGEPTEAITYDVLGNERHKAVCELQKLDGCSPLAHGFRDALAAAIDVPRDGAPYDDKELCHLICDRLIHLLGGDECSISVGENYMDAMGEKSNPAETSGASTGHVILDTPLPEDGTSPNNDGTCPNNDTTSSITDELLDFIDANWPTEFEVARILRETAGSVPSTLLAIASRMERRFAKALISRSSELGCYKLRINQLESERNELKAKLDAIREALDG